MIQNEKSEEDNFVTSMCSSICCCPCLNIFKIWLGPVNWMILNFLGTFENFTFFAKELTTVPVHLGKFSFRWSFRIIVLLASIIMGITISVSEYSMFYYFVLPVKE